MPCGDRTYSPRVCGDGMNLWIMGPGRLGLALGLRLPRAGGGASLVYSGRRPTAPDHPLFRNSIARYQPSLEPVPDALNGILIAVPDDAIPAAVDELGSIALPAGIPVLHASGSQSLDVL